MDKVIRIGTRESQLAVWQATQVQQLLQQYNFSSELVFIKSEGDIDLQTPLYEMGVQGIFTKSLDIALLNNKIDIAVHSMKDVPTQLAKGIVQAAVLKRASYKDLLVYKGELSVIGDQLGYQNNEWSSSSLITHHQSLTIATSSIRRKAQWLNRFPNHKLENLRGNVNTRLRKVEESSWQGAIFAAAGLERINLRPANSIELDWMLPAPAQGAIMVVCREEDGFCMDACENFNHSDTALCTKIERDFLRKLSGGCSTPISALTVIENNKLIFKGSLLSVDGKEKVEVEKHADTFTGFDLGTKAAIHVLENGGQKIIDGIHAAK
ncbi:MAG: hydroxymethylbilane synthase [Bacteroidota bacterium]